MGQRDFPVGQRVEHYQKTVSDLDSRFPTQWDKLGEADDLIKEIITILNGGTLQASSQQIYISTLQPRLSSAKINLLYHIGHARHFSNCMSEL